jgi:hypothetical protein
MTTLDAVGPYEVLRFMPNADVRFVSREPAPVITDAGVLVLGATHSYAYTPAADIVVVPGSEANTMTAMADGQLLNWLRQVHKKLLVLLYQYAREPLSWLRPEFFKGMLPPLTGLRRTCSPGLGQSHSRISEL